MSFSAFLKTYNIWLVQSTAEYQKILIYVIALVNIYILYQYFFWHSDMLFTSQVLEVVIALQLAIDPLPLRGEFCTL